LRTFWPDLSRQQALHNLNTTIYNLRRSLEPDLARGSRSRYIRYQAGRYSIRKKNISVDVLDFMQHIKNGQIEIDPRQALSQYQQAVELYQGGCLDEFTTLGDWFSRKQKRIDDLYIGVLETVAGLQLELGYMESARQSYIDVLALDPLRRHSRQQLLYLLAAENENALLRAQNILDTQIDLQMRLHRDEKVRR
jgi:two-component SAPR family response regulator